AHVTVAITRTCERFGNAASTLQFWRRSLQYICLEQRGSQFGVNRGDCFLAVGSRIKRANAHNCPETESSSRIRDGHEYRNTSRGNKDKAKRSGDNYSARHLVACQNIGVFF